MTSGNWVVCSIRVILLIACLSVVVPAQTAVPPVLRLGLKQAVELATAPEGNVRVRLADELAHQAQARAAQARAALLPNVDATVAQQNRTVNLAALGVRVEVPIPGFSFPSRVGPFNTFDARATLTQNILDFSAIRRYQAARLGVAVAELDSDSAREQIAALVARSYLAALRAEAHLEAVRANRSLAEALLELAEEQKAAGTGTGIEVTRARVQLSNERQRVLVAENELRQAHLQLLRSIGLGLDATVELADRLSYEPVAPQTVGQALERALHARADLQVLRRRQEAARLSYDAARLERWPSLAGFADYGTIGTRADNASPTRTYGVQVRVPLFDGGRRDARRAENRSLLEQERLRVKDLVQQIDLEVRLALDGLASAEEQLKVAGEGLELADSELAQARRRYQAGLASSIEITDAQTRLARARDNRTAALYGFNLARINLAQATGTMREVVK